jgi:hypothetical protein
MEASGQRHAPATLSPGKTRLYMRRGRPQGRSGLVQKISPHRDLIPGPAIRTELSREYVTDLTQSLFRQFETRVLPCSRNKSTLSPECINWLVFAMETYSDHCAVRTELVNSIVKLHKGSDVAGGSAFLAVSVWACLERKPAKSSNVKP